MTYCAEDLLEMAQKIRYDATAIQSKVTELKTAIASLDLPAKKDLLPCPECGIGRPNRELLAEHLENVHGQLPEMA
jgi:hypothetical protein